MRKNTFKSLILLSLLLLCCKENEDPALTLSENQNTLIQEIAAISEKTIEDFRVPGAIVALIDNGEPIKTFYYGYANKEAKIKPSAETLFSLGSISKSLTAWGIMKLAEKGVVKLDVPIANYIKGYQFPEHEFDESKITIRRLLSHSAGLSIPGYRGFDKPHEVPGTIASLEGATNGPGTLKVAYPPGESARYSGGGFTVLQLIIEEVTGSTFSEYMQQEVFAPLGMHQTTFELLDDKMPLKQLSAVPYEESGKRITDRHYAAKAAAGLRSTHNDMIKFIIAEMGMNNNAVLSQNSLDEMHKTRPPARSYGLGHQIRQMKDSIRVIGHVGNNQGWLSNFQFIKKSKAGLLIMTNGNSGFYFQSAVACSWINFYTQTCTNEFCAVVPLAKFAKIKKQIDKWFAEKKISETQQQALNDKIHQIRIIGSNNIRKVLEETQKLNNFLIALPSGISAEELDQYKALYSNIVEELNSLVQQNCID